MGIEFGYWATNLGAVVSTALPQRTDSSFAANKRYAYDAEETGFEFTLVATRFLGVDGRPMYDALATAAGLAAVTSKLKIVIAVLTGLYNPSIVAKMVSTMDEMSGGRVSLNIVSAWNKSEYLAMGEPWLDHEERYRRSVEFIEVLQKLWGEGTATYSGDFFRVRELPSDPKPTGKPYPPIYQGGASAAAKRMAAKYADVWLMNGNTVENLQRETAEIKAAAAAHGREIKTGVNSFVIVRDTEAEAKQVLRDIISNANIEAVEHFRKEVKNGGQSSPEGKGMWAESSLEDLIQFNDGFKTGLIGTAEQVADRIIELKKAGIDKVLMGFLHFDEDLKAFGEQVIPLVREKEQALALAER